MPWQQLIIKTQGEGWPQTIANILEKSGAHAVTFNSANDHEIFEPGIGEMLLWECVNVIALYSLDAELKDLIQVMKTQLPKQNILDIALETLPDTDWYAILKEHFKPMQFSEKLWICPSWCEPTDTNAINIMLDPGLAFGTGTHPTTALCLKKLSQFNLNNTVVIDYGCGSGILAIAASLLGAQKVLACDIDPQAVEATQLNMSKNNIKTSELEVSHCDQRPPILADITVANILTNTLIELKDRLVQTVKTNGIILLSGILASQASQVMQVYQDQFTFEAPILQDGWCVLSGKKKHSSKETLKKT